MDETTHQFYRLKAEEISRRYNFATSGVCRFFSQAFPPEAKVLDIGCGSGRDLNMLLDEGYDAFGVEPCAELAQLATTNFANLYGRIRGDSLPELASINDESYDGVLCSAVLMHLPEEQLFDASFAIRRVLKANGRFLMSVPLSDPTIDSKTKRDADGRLFNGVTPEKHQLLFERLGFKLISRWDSDDGLDRETRKWATMLFALKHRIGGRPIDTIEAVLNKDNKVATYKLALFRALADIATTNYNIAKWRTDGKIGIPLRTLAEKWILYYWPIVESEKFIKQTTGKAIAFRKQLQDLVAFYNDKGGFSAFYGDFREESIPKAAIPLLKALKSKLKSTIWQQPVRYAGGGDDFSVFQYDKSDRTVIIGHDIWNELSLMGTWIQDATILRWAELTSRINKGDVKPSEVIDHLLTLPVSERDVSVAKSFYDSLTDKTCVWTDQSIGPKYDLDHAIPFSLWKNNDLWNLLPTDSKVNAEKKDKLPTNQIVKKRKDCVINYWEMIKLSHPVRFEFEASKIGGSELFLEDNWQNKLFADFTEAIEITAIQRGVERWQPASLAATGTENSFDQRQPVILEETKRVKPSIPTTSLPFYPNLKVACGAFKKGQVETMETLEIEDSRGLLDSSRHCVVKTSGDSMSWGKKPIFDGDHIVLEKNEGGSISNQIFAIEYQDEFGETSYVLKRIVKDAPNRYRLVSSNKNYSDIPVDPRSMFPIARFKFKLEEGNGGFREER